LPKPFDATAKELLESHPESWLDYLQLGVRVPVRVVSAELSTVTAEADKVLRVEDAQPWLVHIELQSHHDNRLAGRLLRYNVLLGYRHEIPVLSTVVLLRREADAPGLTGELRQTLGNGREYLAFHYQVVRTWEQPVEAVLAGGLGTLPLVPLADVSLAALPESLRRLNRRLKTEAEPDEAEKLWKSTVNLLSLRLPPQSVATVLQGIQVMVFGIRDLTEEDLERMAEVEKMGEQMRWLFDLADRLDQKKAEGRAEGRAEEARNLLLRQGSKRFGPPDDRAAAALGAVADVERLERLAERLLDVATWDELLAEPGSVAGGGATGPGVPAQ
jgi:predicted transposase YdaD